MLTLYHDIPSAGALVAMLRLQALADEGLAVEFGGFDVLGLDVTLPATLDDIEDWDRNRAAAADLGWELDRPRLHPSTLTAHLVGELAIEQDLDAAWRMAVYRAHWLEHRDVGAPDVLVDVAGQAGMDVDEVRALVEDHELRHRLRQRMLVHRGDGVGGVPVLRFDGTFVSPNLSDDDLRGLAAL